MLAICVSLGAEAAPIDPCRPIAAETIDILAAAGGRLLVPLTIDQQRTLVELDTGSDLNLLDPAMAARLGLPVRRAQQPILAGADGLPLADFATAHSVRLGRLAAGATSFVVPPSWRVVDSRATAMLGGTFLRAWDLELDLGEGEVKFYPRSRCLDMIPPFARIAEAIPIEAMSGHAVVPVTLDGQPLRALLDTGATISSMSLGQARRYFGLRPGFGDVSPTDETITTDGGRLATWNHRFAALSIGSVRISTPAIDLVNQPADIQSIADHDLVLGLSDLVRLRLYLAYGLNKLWIERSPQ